MRIEEKQCDLALQRFGDSVDEILGNMYRQIERAGRVCYASKPKEGSAKDFVKRMISNGHLSVLEHGTIYLTVSADDILKVGAILHSKYTDYNIHDLHEDGRFIYITTNLRVLIENGFTVEDVMKYITTPRKYHVKRFGFLVRTSIGVTREFNRHRVNSISESSTRYCNYSKDKFGNEVSFIKPWWYDAADTTDDERKEFEDTVKDSERHYMNSINSGHFAERARGALNLDTASTVFYTASLPDWNHFFQLRCVKGAHPDAIMTASLMREALLNYLDDYYLPLSDDVNGDIPIIQQIKQIKVVTSLGIGAVSRDPR